MPYFLYWPAHNGCQLITLYIIWFVYLCYLFIRYKLNITTVSPLEGATTGGLDFTIDGVGFGNRSSDVQVLLGDSPCNISMIDMFTIRCHTSSGAEGVVDLKVRKFILKFQSAISVF